MASVTIGSHIDCIDVSNNEIAVGTSNLTGKTWNGEIVLLQLSDSLELTEKKRIVTESGNTTVKYLNPTTLVAAGDEGVLKFYNLNGKQNTPIRSLAEHDDIITSIDINKHSNLLSGSWDLSIKVWPEKAEHSIHTYTGHLHYIWTTQWNPKSPNVFASGSQDKTIRLWDDRNNDSTLVKELGQPVFSLAFGPDEFSLAVGLENGEIRLIDTRNTSQTVSQFKLHETSIKQIKFDPFTATRLAAASDDGKISIFDTTTSKTTSVISEHSDYVRALSWIPKSQNVLISGSWDKTVRLHKNIQ